eukprot:TRINITY_DN7455_c0_g1_i4.p1 TRINITY_DN7455_c0_g1~~TRINITY_DN7455_c0_g1_i4.p1  ORF type:complete len:159 (+),score=3.50 TRINITY_DN7455_c0_g1_i4:64-540(+)
MQRSFRLCLVVLFILICESAAQLCLNHYTYYTTTGTLTEGPDAYDNNMILCFTVIPNPTATSITFTVTALDLELSRDFVRIDQGLSATNASFVVSLTGGLPTQRVYTVTGPAAFIRFTSNGLGVGQGFTITYTSVIPSTLNSFHGTDAMRLRFGAICY